LDSEWFAGVTVLLRAGERGLERRKRKKEFVVFRDAK
jgi:hypothetical protein